MILATTIATVLLIAGGAAALVRAVRGPSVADRMVAVDTLLHLGVGGIGVYIVRSGDTTYLPLMVVAVVIAFIGTIVVARYIEAETKR